jgi:hypothetical protein
MTRNELFAMVWKEPLALLAPKFGMSKPTLLRLCRIHNVPVPGRGHWAKVRAGVPVERTPIEEPERDPEIQIKSGDGAGSEVKEAEHLLSQGCPFPFRPSVPDSSSQGEDLAVLLQVCWEKHLADASASFREDARGWLGSMSPEAAEYVRRWLSTVGKNGASC